MPKNSYDSYKDLPSARLLSDRCRLPVEQLVSEHYHQEWRVETFDDMNDFASHPSAILSDGTRPVFVKLNEAAHGLHQFEAEMAGLRLLTDRAGILTPTPVGIASFEGGVILVLEAVQAVERTPHEWREIGRTLARIHLNRGDRFGLELQGYWGPLYQDNRPTADWLSFYTERRLWPRLIGAIDSGNLSTDIIRQVEKLVSRLPGLDIPPMEPVLLHGDAQQNNFISTAAGAVAVDPSVYYGHPEMDLAYVDFFQAVPEDIFAGYREILPIDPGLGERRDLWRLPAYLALVDVGGSDYLDLLTQALKKYI